MPNERRCYFLKIPPKAEQSASYRRVVAAPRASCVPRLPRRDALSVRLFEKWRELDGEDELLVYPALLPDAFSEGAAQEEGDQAGSSRGRGTETRELREYRDGDETRAIHWRRTAAIGKPVVREYEREAASVLSIVLDNRARRDAAAAWDESFEHASRARPTWSSVPCRAATAWRSARAARARRCSLAAARPTRCGASWRCSRATRRASCRRPSGARASLDLRADPTRARASAP